MPTSRNWFHFAFVNLAVILFLCSAYFSSQVVVVKQNWPLYRCNPLYMPLADNIGQNFSYCIQNTQMNFMGNLLQPLTYITTSLTSSLGSFMTEINSIRGMFNKVRTFFSSIIQSVFSVFLNMVIEFQKISITIQDMVGKITGIVVSIMYIIDGSQLTMMSAWNGPPGQAVRAMGQCFHPETNVRLKSGATKNMKDIDLGDVLEDGSYVISSMKIDNKRVKHPLYVIRNNGVNGEDIYVTGTHFVYDNIEKHFVKVENYKKAVLSNKDTEWFSCLITSNHHIKIGDELFWDWEDYMIQEKQKTE
jgi:hypothetical protein